MHAIKRAKTNQAQPQHEKYFFNMLLFQPANKLDTRAAAMVCTALPPSLSWTSFSEGVLLVVISTTNISFYGPLVDIKWGVGERGM